MGNWGVTGRNLPAQSGCVRRRRHSGCKELLGTQQAQLQLAVGRVKDNSNKYDNTG